jgi:general secretion pathway protein K
MMCANRQQGLALLIVLWALVLLTVIGLSFSYAVRVENQTGIALSDRVRAEAVAAAGVRRAILGVLTRDRELQWQADGRTYDIPWPDATLRVLMRSEAGKIDLNAAAPELLEGLFELVLEDDGEVDPEALAAQVVDWRDRDDDRTMKGAEDEEYRDIGRENAPRNDRLQSVGELAEVLDFNGNMVRLLEPHLTVLSNRPKVDASSATATVLAAVPGIDLETAQAFVEDREARLAADEKIDTDTLSAGRKYIESRPGGGVLSILAEATLADGGQAQVEAVVSIGGRGQPYTILDWRYPLPGLDGQADPAQTDNTDE